ncbi:type 1 glutamine amidotransferase domain-containing protein [Corynebacterium lowii]|uniref:Molecular chaperone Hsp31 and glyoxalase 3 n=1 Tax=Corynebacterium lowii TaxID=1544413 RepID=A0A0Q0UGB5_9CORY|nr:type 1 glutamine amidotransferase domain-containing protein [Corynebacterium lowii]KQB85718.1 Molecular chaperone Hsp31 and glyoxalase 3 [Corynebacterium lowii]MDP9851020.1 putative intracellular protease/amidase [Corynebacterium lowii]
MKKVLMVVTGAQYWTLKDGTRHPTGFWAEEFLVPYETFLSAGYDITIATPDAQIPVVDQLSLGLRGGVTPGTAQRFRARLRDLAPILNNPADLAQIDQGQYDLVFYPGGHGPMEDLAFNTTSAAILNARLASGRPLALLCHAPAALLATAIDAPSSSFAGRKVTGLSNVEERINPFGWKASWLLEDKLKEMGMQYSKGFPLRPHVVVDGNLYTGQNPQSSKKLAETLVHDLQRL